MKRNRIGSTSIDQDNLIILRRISGKAIGIGQPREKIIQSALIYIEQHIKHIESGGRIIAEKNGNYIQDCNPLQIDSALKINLGE